MNRTFVPFLVMLGGGGVAAIGFLWDGQAAWGGVLTAAWFGLSLSLGAALFVAIQAVAGARWWGRFQEPAARVARSIGIPAALMAFVLVAGAQVLYPWTDAAVAEGNHAVHAKHDWLELAFFVARGLGILAIWVFAVDALTRRLAEATTKPARYVRASALFILLFAVTISVATWDWLMSLEPEWFSTMFGVYAFAGAFQGGLALTLVVALSRREGALIGADALHDMGKLLFGFSFFWGYIWFCQFMLIWYANLPEETAWFAHRLEGGWSMLFWLNPILCFALPFLLLLGRGPKRRRSALIQVGVLVLVGRWVDVLLIVGPSSGRPAEFPTVALAATAALAAGMLLWGGYQAWKGAGDETEVSDPHLPAGAHAGSPRGQRA